MDFHKEKTKTKNKKILKLKGILHNLYSFVEENAYM